MTGLNKILAALVVAQAGLLVGLQMQGEDTLKVTSVTVLEGLDTSKVTRLSIWGAPKEGSGPAQESVVLDKVNGAWTIGSTDGFAADGKKVDELLKTLQSLRSQTVVLEGAAYHAKLEVSADKFQRKVTLQAGETTQTFFVGSSPSFKNVHVRVEGSDQVLLVNEFGSAQIGSRAWHWVDRTYQDIPEDQVWQVRVSNAKGSLQLDKDPTSLAWAVLGQDGEVDTAAVKSLVGKARTVNIEAPVGKTEAPEYGLGTPLATVTLTTGTSTIAGAPPPSTSEVVVKVGKKIEADNQYYLKASNNPYVVKVAAWAVTPLLEKGKEDLVKKPD